MEGTNNHDIQGFQKIREILIQARGCVLQAINTEMVACYWQIGHPIVEEEQRGQTRAAYGKGLIKELGWPEGLRMSLDGDSINATSGSRGIFIWPTRK